jgi:hypothetical protein
MAETNIIINWNSSIDAEGGKSIDLSEGTNPIDAISHGII